MATLDHIGLNRFIYMSSSNDTMTLGSHTISDISNSSGLKILGGELDVSRILLGVNLYNNGPYGYSSWQQTRMSENPLSRHLRKNNQYPIVENGKEKVYFQGQKRYVIPERYGRQLVLDEPAIVSNYKPIGLIGAIDDYNDRGNPFLKKFNKKISMNNNISYFTNDQINNIAGLVEEDDEAYEILKNYYLEDNLNSGESPMSSFEKLIFRQTIYPPQQYTYKSYTRNRTTFTFDWNSDINTRQELLTVSDDRMSFNVAVKNRSVWPLDVSPDWQTRALPLSQYVGYNTYPNGNDPNKDIVFTGFSRKTTSFGELWNHYSQLAERLFTLTTCTSSILFAAFSNSFVVHAALYSRRHTLPNKESVVAPSGMSLARQQDMNGSTIFGGEAYWDVPEQSGKSPFPDSYDEFSDTMRRKAKDYTVVPEYRMSSHVPTLLSSGSFFSIDNIFELTGAKSNCSDSSKDDFYKIYSNSDFLKNFDILLEDHRDFTDPSKITLKCKAMKKLVPYDGFYPAQRTLELAQQFHNSYQPNTLSRIYQNVSSSFSIDGAGANMINIMTPLFAPGVLFNTIKSGVAVDYPIITEPLETNSAVLASDSTKSFTIKNLDFDKRIPFESLVEPDKYLAGYALTCNEPHISGNLSSSVQWSGEGDNLYTKMANNFIAEIPQFFLKDQKLTTISSLPQSDPNFGQLKSSLGNFGFPQIYSMRIKMYRSMDKPNTPVTSSTTLYTTRYLPPQDIIDSDRAETITMYSRPSAFGPPSDGTTTGSLDDQPDSGQVASTNHKIGSRQGYNFPFTPPYYHGQAWADVVFRPRESKKYTLSEIFASSSVQYYRFDTDCWQETTVKEDFGGPQQLHKVNDNAKQINSSVNIFAKGTLSEASEQETEFLSNLNIKIDDQSQSRWIIQPKFETPILNFQHQSANKTLPQNASSASVPVGMWHQYGKIPDETEGIYLQVTDIPRSWTRGRLGQSEANLNKTGSLAELCGFSQNPVKLGQINARKKISECVVAIPFTENRGIKEFFKIKKKFVDKAIDNAQDADVTLVNMVDKMKRFIFPPTFDFVNFPENVDPIAMYIFEFSHRLSQQDLADIWQNVLPEIGQNHQEAVSTISHSLIGEKKLINRRKLREDIRWMVFKVKQRAASRYYDQVFAKKGDKTENLKSEVTADSAGDRSKIQYNWPYDFFSLVELVKIDAAVEFSDVETDDGGNEQTKPKVAKEENRRRRLDTLFPKGRK